MRLLLLLLALAAGLAAPAAAQPTPHAEVRLVADAAAVAPGDSLWLSVRIAAEDGWHVYWSNPGDSGLPVRVAWTLSQGATAGALLFPAPVRIDIAGLTSYAHEGTTDFLTRVAVPPGASGTLEMAGDVAFLICADVCLPAKTTVSIGVPVAGETRRTEALAGALAALPRAPTGWTASADASGPALRLRLTPPAGWTGDWSEAQFFPDSSGAIVTAAAQAFERDGQGWAVPLAAGTRVPARLTGVLTAPGAPSVRVEAPVSGASAAAAPASAGVGLLAALGLAFLGGVLLNLMPCVFPVLSLKLLSFTGGHDDGRQRQAGLAYGAGVVVSFWALAAALLALRAGGAGLGWGFQLQSPPVIAFLAALMVAVALNLLGVFEVGGRLASAGGALDRGTGARGAFGSGVLATVVATPCTAPFMAGALGFALSQPAWAALAVFTALGVGMALPLVALAFVPRLAERLPRPGPWMETLRQALAFPLLATAVWLVWVFGQQAGVNGAGALLHGARARRLRRVARRPVARPRGDDADACAVSHHGRPRARVCRRARLTRDAIGPSRDRAGGRLGALRRGARRGARRRRHAALHRRDGGVVPLVPGQRADIAEHSGRRAGLQAGRRRQDEGRLDEPEPGDHGAAHALRPLGRADVRVVRRQGRRADVAARGPHAGHRPRGPGHRALVPADAAGD